MIRRGETIVEVVVACGILTVLFVAVANMIVSSVKLNDDARIRMETVSLAQKELNSFIVAGNYDTGGDASAPDITTDSGSCRLKLDGTVIGPNKDGTGVFYTNKSYIGCKEKTAEVDFLNANYPDKKCHYIIVRDLKTANPDETQGGIVRSDKFVVVESNVRWTSRALGFQQYVVKKLVRR